MKICILDALTLGKDIDISPLKNCGEVISYELTTSDQVVERIQDVDVIITNKVILREEALKEAKQLKLIALTATGYNNIDVAYAKSRGIGVANVAGYSTQSVAQHTFAMLFYLLEQLKQYDEYVKSKAYASSETFAYIAWPFHELTGKTLGIIGLGAIGRAVAKIAEAFGMKVIYYSATGKHQDTAYEWVDFESLLAQSDILSIHAPLNEKTEGLLNYEAMKQMKRSAILLNLGRGAIVVEEDLARALNEGLIAGAGLDVLTQEPIHKENPLYQVKDPSKLLITPHIAWASIEARTVLVEEVVQNIEAFKKGEMRNRIV